VFACNTLGHVLGNATFIGDAALGEGVRCYVFEDDRRRGVAALWTSTFDVDSGRRQGPVLTLAKLPKGAELIDMAGRQSRLTEPTVALSSCPVFIRGPKRSAAALLATLRESRLAGADIRSLRATFRLVTSTEAAIVVRNILSRPLEGRMRLSQSARVVFDGPATLVPGAEWTRTVKLPAPSQGLGAAAFGVEFTPASGAVASVSQIELEWSGCRRITNALTIDGRLDDWPAANSFEMARRHREWAPDATLRDRYPKGVPWQGPADLSARLYTAWDAEHLYLALRVRDDVHDPENPASPKARMWEGDGVQLYLDCWADGRLKPHCGYDNNDQVFDLWPQTDGLKVSRAVAPEQQLAFLKPGPVPAARAACVRTARGETIYEMALPLGEISPLRLQKGACFGMGLLINDRDGDYRKRGLTLTPAGTEPCMRPDLWPLLILEE